MRRADEFLHVLNYFNTFYSYALLLQPFLTRFAYTYIPGPGIQ